MLSSARLNKREIIYKPRVPTGIRSLVVSVAVVRPYASVVSDVTRQLSTCVLCCASDRDQEVTRSLVCGGVCCSNNLDRAASLHVRARMGAQSSRQTQLTVDSGVQTRHGAKKSLSRRASTGALLSRQERQRELHSVETAARIAAARATSSTLSSASSLGCLLSTTERSSVNVRRDAEDISSHTSETTNLPVSRASSNSVVEQTREAPGKAALSKKNSKSLAIASRIAPTLKKLAKRSTKIANNGSSSRRGDGESGCNDVTEAVSTEFLSMHRDETIEDGDLGDTSSTVEWNGTTLRKSWFNDDRAGSSINLATGNGACSRGGSRADSVHDVHQRSASLSSRQCRRTGSVGSLLSTGQGAVTCSTDELISTASCAVSSLSLASNGGVVTLRQRCSSQASQAFSVSTNNTTATSRRSSSSSIATHSTCNPLTSHSRQQQAGSSSAFTPQSQISAAFRSTSRSHSRSSNRYSSPSCSPPLTRAPTKLELLLGFSRCAVARCPGVGARHEDVELWVRGTDRALIKSGWQEQPFLCTGNMVLVYGIFLVAMQTETVRTVSDLRGVILTCLYVAFTYGGHEISYPLKPFLYTTDRGLFWDRCVRIALSSSSLMLQINRQEALYHDLLISLHDELYSS